MPITAGGPKIVPANRCFIWPETRNVLNCDFLKFLSFKRCEDFRSSGRREGFRSMNRSTEAVERFTERKPSRVPSERGPSRILKEKKQKVTIKDTYGQRMGLFAGTIFVSLAVKGVTGQNK